MENIKVDSIPRGDVSDTPALTHCMLNSFKDIYIYRKVSNIRRTKSQNLNASRLIW